MKYLVFCLVFQTSCWRRESWLLYFNCALDALWLSVFCITFCQWWMMIHAYLLFLITLMDNSIDNIKNTKYVIKKWEYQGNVTRISDQPNARGGKYIITQSFTQKGKNTVRVKQLEALQNGMNAKLKRRQLTVTPNKTKHKLDLLKGFFANSTLKDSANKTFWCLLINKVRKKLIKKTAVGVTKYFWMLLAPWNAI